MTSSREDIRIAGHLAASVGFVILATLVSLLLLRGTVHRVSRNVTCGEMVLRSAPEFDAESQYMREFTTEDVFFIAEMGLVLAPDEYRISRYDLILRIAGLEHDVDWRLLAALCYYESHFRHDIVSPRGAVGLMQVMPRIARRMGVRKDMLRYPLTNARVSAGIVNMFRRMVRSLGEIDGDDRMAFVIAGYNSGMKHLEDAVTLARMDGCDRVTWDEASRYLIRLNDPEVFGRDSVSGGQFHEGKETVAYVNAVMNRYRSYRSGGNVQ